MFAGAKGGSATFKQTPDNLRSNDTFEGVLGLCVGPIKGPTNGLKSIKLDETAVENATGQLNFTDFVANVADGDPLKFPQKVQLRLGAGASPQQVGLTLTNTAANTNPTAGAGPWATRTMANTGANFVDLRFIVSQLYKQDAKGIYDLFATIDIEMKPVGSTTWINPTLSAATGGTQFTNEDGSVSYLPSAYYAGPSNNNYRITGKTSSPAVYELRIGLPNTGAYANKAWDIRCRLEERDNFDQGNGNKEVRTISWESLAAVYTSTLGDHEDWRGLSWLQVYGKASDQLTGVPEISGEYDTKIVSVPASAVYNPTTRQYTAGVWDGSWAKAFTTDPAWVISDAISDELSGLSLIARGSYLNKWDALDLSKHCSELVSDGNGGTHPRYNMNIAISQPQKAEEFIRYLAGAVGALAWDQGNGEWRVKVDKADNPSDIFTLDNIEGEFIYSHTDVDTRFNDIVGQFKNAEMEYRGDAVHLYDNTSIALLGRKPTTIALVGCTDRQEAMRRVKLRLRSTVNENRIVTFTTNRRGRNIEQLSTILIADGDLGDQDKRTTGRAVSVASDRMSIIVRDTMYLAPGVSYKMWFTVPNPSYAPQTTTQPVDADWTKPTRSTYRNVVNTSGQRGAVTTIYLDTALPEDIAENLSVGLEATDLPTMPRLFRVTNAVPLDDGERISISAINIDTGKWAASDNVTNSDTVFQDLRGQAPTPLAPLAGRILSIIRVPVQQGHSVNLVANWRRPAGAFINGFNVRFSINGGALQSAVEGTQETTFEWVNPVAGTYYVEVTTVDRRGSVSLALVDTFEVTQEILDAGDIRYVDPGGGTGPTVQTLRPAEPGATNSADPASAFGATRTIGQANAALTQLNLDIAAANLTLAATQQIITDTQAIADALQGNLLLQQAEAMLDTVRQDVDRRNTDTRTYIQGQPMGAIVVHNEEQRVAADDIFVGNFNLLGARSTNGLAWVLDTNKVLLSPTQSMAERFSSINATFGQQSATISTLDYAISNPNGAVASKLTTLDTRMGTAESSVSNLLYSTTNPNGAVASALTSLSTRMGTNESSVSQLLYSTTNPNGAVASALTSLQVQSNDRQAQINDLFYVTVNASDSLAARITSLNTRTGTAESNISDILYSTTNYSGAIATSLRNLGTRMGTAESNVSSLLYSTSDPKGAVASALESLRTRTTGTEGSIDTLKTVVSNPGGSVGSLITSLKTSTQNANSRLDTVETSISTPNGAVASAISSLQASYNGPGGVSGQISSLRDIVVGPSGGTGRVLNLIDINGAITGTLNTLTGGVSDYSIIADNFKIVSPGGGSPTTPFSISGGIVSMPIVQVGTLINNTAMVPARAVDSYNVQTGGWSDISQATSDDSAKNEIIGTGLYMPKPGWVEVVFTGKQGFSGTNTAWEFIIDWYGAGVRNESRVGGRGPQDGITTAAYFYVAAAQNLYIRVLWNGLNNAVVLNRTLIVKGFPGTS